MKPDDGVHINTGNAYWDATKLKPQTQDPIEKFASIFNKYDRSQDGTLDEQDNLTEQEQRVVNVMKSRFFGFCQEVGISVEEFSFNVINTILNTVNGIRESMEEAVLKPTIDAYEEEDLQEKIKKDVSKYLKECIINHIEPEVQNLRAGQYGFTNGGKTNVYPNGIMIQGNEIRTQNGIVIDIEKNVIIQEDDTE